MALLGGVQGGDLPGQVVPDPAVSLWMLIVTTLKPFHVVVAVRSAAEPEMQRGVWHIGS